MVKVIPQFGCIDEVAVLFALSKRISYENIPKHWKEFLHGQSKFRMVNLRRKVGLRHWPRNRRWDSALFNPEQNQTVRYFLNI